MGELILVRHGQASFFGADYDELSAQGREQSRALGAHWARHGLSADTVYIGPRRRHRQTYDEVATAFRDQGRSFPAPLEIPELDEHHGLAVMQHALGSDRGAAEAMREAEQSEAAREAVVRAFFTRYLEVMGDWASGALVVPGVETWAEFRERSLRALDRLCAGRGTTVAFTSGGLVASATGWLLGLDDTRVIDLSAMLRNTALTEVRSSSRRRSLVSFNALPHLPDLKSATAV